MPALRARFGVVGNFVGQQAKACGFLGRRVVQRGGEVIIRQNDRAAAMQCLVLRSGLDGQLVQRQMVRHQVQRATQFRPPRGDALSRPRINQIERYPREQPTRDLQRRDRLRHRMLTSQCRERFRLQTLNADGNPVDPGIAQRGEAGRFDRRRIGLKGDFQIVLDVEQRPRILQQPSHRFRLHQTGRSATEKNRA